MRLIVTDEDRHLLNRAFEGLEEKVQEEFVFLREPVCITDAEMDQLSAYLRFRLETFGIVALTMRALAAMGHEKGFGDEESWAKVWVPSGSTNGLPDEVSEALFGGHGSDVFYRVTDRAEDLANVRMAPINDRVDELFEQARRETEGSSQSLTNRWKVLMAEEGLTDPNRDLHGEMHEALYRIDNWFLNRLMDKEPVS